MAEGQSLRGQVGLGASVGVRGSICPSGATAPPPLGPSAAYLQPLRLRGSVPRLGLQEPLPELRHDLPARRLLRLTRSFLPNPMTLASPPLRTAQPVGVVPAPPIDLSRALLPPASRPGARLSCLDITEFFGESSGGVRTYLLEKARYVAHNPQLRQVIVVPGARDAMIDEDGVRWYHLRGPRIPTQDPYRFMLATRTTRRIMAHERPDLIEVGSHFVVPWLAHRATRRLDIPLVWFYHSNLPRLFAPRIETAHPLRRMAANLAWRYMHRLSRLVVATLVSSDFSAADLERLGVENIVRVPLGVDLHRFHPRRRGGAEETRRRFTLPPGPLAIFVGRVAREKELSVLLDAWPMVERRTGAHLAVVGNGPSRRHFMARARASQVRWLPHITDREDVADLLAAADLYISPCSIETFGLAPLEALASGTPVLSADRGGVSERVLGSGAGALFPSGDAGGLAEAAVRLLHADLRLLGDRGRAFAEANHSWDHVFSRLFGVYEALLAGRTARTSV